MLVLKSGDGKISVAFHDQFISAGLSRGYKSNMGLNTWKAVYNTTNAALGPALGSDLVTDSMSGGVNRCIGLKYGFTSSYHNLDQY